jgi:hypothetical protein
LLFYYRGVYDTLYELQYGSGLRSEIARLVGLPSPEQNEEKWIASVRARQFELDEFVPANLPEEDWAWRAKQDLRWELAGRAKPILFDRLVRANAVRTIRKIATQATLLKGSLLGYFLREHPELLLRIKASQGFPRSLDRRIDFLARSIAAVLAGYRPSTGRRYLGRRELCEQCGVRRAVMDLVIGTNSYAWCGAC